MTSDCSLIPPLSSPVVKTSSESSFASCTSMIFAPKHPTSSFRRWGKEIIAEKADELARDYLVKAVQDEKLKPGGRISLNLLEYGEEKPLKFTVTFILAPEVKLSVYKGLNITINDAEISDSDVDRELDGLRLRQLQALASHLQIVREEERIQVARELHDELSPVLTVLKMGVVKIGNSLAEHKNSEEFKDLIKKAKSMESTIDESVKLVRRIITRLRPGILDDLGLIPAIEWLVEEFQENFGLICNLSSNLEQGDVDLNSKEFTAVFRIFQELLTNIVRHAGASKVNIALKRENIWIYSFKPKFEFKEGDLIIGLGPKETVEEWRRCVNPEKFSNKS